MNNFQNNYLTYLSVKYNSLTKNNPGVPKVVIAIRTIEEDNRRLLWRMAEYVICILELVLFPLRRQMTDYSIGKYQIKLSMLLEYNEIDYIKFGKTLFIKEDVNVVTIAKVLSRCNDPGVITDTIKKCAVHNRLENLNCDDIEKIALYYSRNIEFGEGVNYFTALKYLLNMGT